MANDTKPPLSDPMAEALAEDAADAARTATPIRVLDSETPAEAVSAEPAVDATPAPTDPAPTDDAGKKRRTPVEVLQSRIGAKTKEAARLQTELLAARALLAAQRNGEGETTTPPPAGERTYTRAEMEAEAHRVSEERAFNQRANDTYSAGKEKFGDWETNMQTLRDTGFMSSELVDAAIASGAAADVLNHLGGNVDEAERISALSPVRMGVELGKLATKLGAPKSARISSAPAPIETVSGNVTPAMDFAKLAEGDSMAAWVEARKKAGDPWAIGRRR